MILVIASVVENSADLSGNPEVIGLSAIAAIAIAAIHLWSKQLHCLLYREEYIAASFSGGMAISYVFMNLLPELDTAEEVLGHSIHFIILLGFLIFYSLESLVWKTSNARSSQRGFIFGIELFFYCLYNGLLIYTIPKVSGLSITGLPYLIAISFHLMHNNHILDKKYGKLFVWGRYCLVGTIALSLVLDVVTPQRNILVSDFLVAFLAGSIMFNIFYDELPSPRKSRLRWFIAGAILYAVLKTSSLAFS